MLHWFKTFTSGCCDSQLTPDAARVVFLRKENATLRKENAELREELASCDKLLCEAEARNYKLAVDLAEARRQSDAFEKISREACAELEGKKPVAKRKKVA